MGAMVWRECIAGMARLCLRFALVLEVRAECGTPTGRSARKHG